MGAQAYGTSYLSPQQRQSYVGQLSFRVLRGRLDGDQARPGPATVAL
jgi:uncharacterized protein YueI